MKHLTREQLQSRKDAAIRFAENVLRDPDKADAIEDESLEDYADRRHIELINLGRRSNNMANGGNGRSKTELLDEIDDLKARKSGPSRPTRRDRRHRFAARRRRRRGRRRR